MGLNEDLKIMADECKSDLDAAQGRLNGYHDAANLARCEAELAVEAVANGVYVDGRAIIRAWSTVAAFEDAARSWTVMRDKLARDLKWYTDGVFKGEPMPR